eukprot:TRINITY_DN6706_c0_g1_i1.p1 TRINITY_DN6706_c0_g1~~TRINITY_DN6706_c0_g1_i1.p1  ORF type:complete len:838 (+),score=137.44 TRINITY_DN6706_c0_g1_i1:539-3052(+)
MLLPTRMVIKVRKHVIDNLGTKLALKPLEWWEERSGNDIARALQLFAKYHVIHSGFNDAVRSVLRRRVGEMGSLDLCRTITSSIRLQVMEGRHLTRALEMFQTKMADELVRFPMKSRYVSNVVCMLHKYRLSYPTVAHLLVDTSPENFHSQMQTLSGCIRYIVLNCGVPKALGFCEKQRECIMHCIAGEGVQHPIEYLKLCRELYVVGFERPTVQVNLEKFIAAHYPRFTMIELIAAAATLPIVERNPPCLSHLGRALVFELRSYVPEKEASVRDQIYAVSTVKSKAFIAEVVPALAEWIKRLPYEVTAAKAEQYTSLLKPLIWYHYDWKPLVTALTAQIPTACDDVPVLVLFLTNVAYLGVTDPDVFVGILGRVPVKSVPKQDVETLVNLFVMISLMNKYSFPELLEAVVKAINVAYNLDRSNAILHRSVRRAAGGNDVVALLTGEMVEEPMELKKIRFRHLMRVMGGLADWRKPHVNAVPPVLKQLHWVYTEVLEQMDNAKNLKMMDKIGLALRETGCSRAYGWKVVEMTKKLMDVGTVNTLCSVVSRLGILGLVSASLTQRIVVSLRRRRVLSFTGRSASQLASYMTAARVGQDPHAMGIFTHPRVTLSKVTELKYIVSFMYLFTNTFPPEKFVRPVVQILAGGKKAGTKAEVEFCVTILVSFRRMFTWFRAHHPVPEWLHETVSCIIQYIVRNIDIVKTLDITKISQLAGACVCYHPSDVKVLYNTLGSILPSLELSEMTPSECLAILSSFSYFNHFPPSLRPFVAVLVGTFTALPPAELTQAAVTMSRLRVHDERFWGKLEEGMKRGVLKPQDKERVLRLIEEVRVLRGSNG